MFQQLHVAELSLPFCARFTYTVPSLPLRAGAAAGQGACRGSPAAAGGGVEAAGAAAGGSSSTGTEQVRRVLPIRHQGIAYAALLL
jgi:hypothetical protein